MITVKYIDDNKFEVDGFVYPRSYHLENPGGRYHLVSASGKITLGNNLAEIEVQKQGESQASTYATVEDLSTALAEVVFSIGGSEGEGSHWVAVETESTADYILKGGLNGTAWQINRYDRNNNMSRTAATETDNSAYNTLEAAWENRTTLNYS